jgi:large subunit ribosomal protein L10
MKLRKNDKIKLAKTFAAKLKKEKTFIITNYEGLTSKEANELRVHLFGEGIEYKAIKKTIINRILKNTKLEDFNILTESGQMAIAWAKDGAKLAKIINDFSQEHNKDMIVAGFINGDFLAKDKMILLSKLPGIEILRAQFVFSLKGTMSRFVNVLNGNQRKLVNVLNAIREIKV